MPKAELYTMVQEMIIQPFGIGFTRNYPKMVLEPNYRRLTVGNTPAFPAMPELNAMGQMDPVVRHAHEERMENYKIHMRSYTEAATRKLDRDCGTATGILLLS
jgi:hypothetical protein